MSPTLGTTLGLFGKIAAEPDFVSLGDDCWSRAELDTWLQEALAAVRASRRPFPDRSTLLLAVGGGPVVGALWPSADAAGRPFPLVLCSALEAGAASGEARAVFALDDNPVLRAAAAVAGRAAEGASATALEGALGDAAAAFDRDRRAGESRVAELLGSPARPLLTQLADAAAYAFTTLRTACREARDGALDGDAPDLLLRCPAATEGARVFWIVFAQRLLDQVALSFVDVREPERAYIDLCLGAPPATLIASTLSDETGPGHWSLVPRGAEARASALAGLSGAQADVLAGGEPTFADLLRVFVP